MPQFSRSELPSADDAGLAAAHEQHSRRILEAVESDHRVSQRSLARDLGIALGLTNLLVKHLVRRGFLRIIHVRPNRVSYLITPTGLAEKARMSRRYFESSVAFYREARDRIRQRFAALSELWPELDGSGKPIVFYGANEVAEISFICLPETDLQLVGIVDNEPGRRFFDVTVVGPEHLNGLRLDDRPFDRIVVMSFSQPEALRARVDALGVPAERIFWL